MKLAFLSRLFIPSYCLFCKVSNNTATKRNLLAVPKMKLTISLPILLVAGLSVFGSAEEIVSPPLIRLPPCC